MPAGKNQYRKGEYPTFEDYSIYAQRVVLNGEFVQHSHDFDEIVLIFCGTPLPPGIWRTAGTCTLYSRF